MNKRIKKIASYIEEKDKVADIGCDQALLSIYLAKNNIKSIAIDLRSHIIDRCKDSIIKLNLQNLIDLRVGDGLNSLNVNEVDTLVLSGLGTHTILNIIKKEKYKFKKIITISNNHHKELRAHMLEFGYKVSLEEIIYEKGKYYNLIIFIPGVTKYSLSDLNIGLNHQNKELLEKYNQELLKKYIKIYKKSNDKNIRELINIIKSYKY